MDITFWTTQDCNLNCRYCYNRVGNNIKKEYMSYKVIKESFSLLTGLEEWNKEERFFISFHGGEPLLNCDAIEEIMNTVEKAVAREKIVYGMTTNGTLYGQRQKEIIKKLDNISVSVDGKSDIHNLYRVYLNGEGSFERVIKTAKEISKYKKMRIRVKVTHKTILFLYETICFFLQEGFNKIDPILDMFDSHWVDEDEELIIEQFRRVKNYVQENGYDEASIAGVTYTPLTPKGICDGGVTNFHILPDGTIYPCSLAVGDTEWIIGRTDQGLYQEKINLIQKMNDIETNNCIGCSMYKYCPSSRCKLVNKRISGSYNTASGIMCLESRLQLEAAKCV